MKKMNQRVTAMIMSMVLVLALAGCGAGTEGDANASENQNAVPRVEVADSAEVLNKVWDTYGDEEKFFVMGGDFDNPVENAAGIFSMENAENMTREMRRVKSAQVTYAVRNTVIDDKEIHEGDIMGIGDHGILAVGASVDTTAVDTLKAMLDEESELVTIYYGADVELKEAEALLEKASAACPDVDIELQDGGQPIYYYLISVE